MDPAKLPTREKGYISPRREAAWRFVHYGGEDENESFWDKLNCANHRLNNLANQMVKPTQQALQRECEGAVPYVYRNVAAVEASCVEGKMAYGHSIANLVEGAPGKFATARGTERTSQAYPYGYLAQRCTCG